MSGSSALLHNVLHTKPTFPKKQETMGELGIKVGLPEQRGASGKDKYFEFWSVSKTFTWNNFNLHPIGKKTQTLSIKKMIIKYATVPNCDENIQSEVASHNELSSTNDNELLVVCHYHDDAWWWWLWWWYSQNTLRRILRSMVNSGPNLKFWALEIYPWKTV